MPEVNVQLCPETGICSIIRADGSKVDLMPDEVGSLRDAGGTAEAVRKALTEVDPGFAAALDAAELGQIAARVK